MAEPSQQPLPIGWIAAAVVVPIAIWLALPAVPLGGSLGEPFSRVSILDSSPRAFTRTRVGPRADEPAAITHVDVVDLDGDGTREILVCDCRSDRVLRYDRAADGSWTETVLASEIDEPCRASVVDLDGDGDQDVLVAVLGELYPNDTPVGAVLALVNDGQGAFAKRTVLAEVRRITDVQGGDLDGDGDIDLAVAEFGQVHGRVLWLEQTAPLTFEPHTLWRAGGAIHVPLADYDGDGDLDIATNVSQNDEEVLGFESLGGGQFQPRRLFSTLNHDLGSAGLSAGDLDGDGDVDLVLATGDNFELSYAHPQPYHGAYWLENRGNFQFETRQIGALGGCYAADIGDVDGDGDQDVVLGSMFNDWKRDGATSVAWLENDGAGGFRPWHVDADPRYLVTVCADDLDGDGKAEIVAGAWSAFVPNDPERRIALWTSAGGDK